MSWAVVVLALLTYCQGIDGQSAWPQAPSSSVSLGGTITLSCPTSQSSNSIGWTQQKSGGALRYVHRDGYNRGEGIPDRFTATRSRNTGSLTITNVEAEDEAVYYCDRWMGSAWVFGGGTELIVTGGPTKSPKVDTFSTTEGDMTTFVCTITNYAPKGIDVKWKANGVVITSDVQTSKATKQGSSYNAVSYLTLTETELKTHDHITCEVTHEGNTYAKSVSTSGTC